MHRSIPVPAVAFSALMVCVVVASCGGDTTQAAAEASTPETTSAARDRSKAGHEVRLPELDSLPEFDYLSLCVQEAYAAIPHRRTAFDFARTGVPETEAEYLRRAFHLIDEGVRVRVEAYRDLYHRGTSSVDPVARMDDLIDAFESMRPPGELAEYQAAVVRALAAQRDVFDDWSADGLDFADRDNVGRNAKVREASRHLKEAYGILMRTYGGSESSVNKNAFFDYHCALDFI